MSAGTMTAIIGALIIILAAVAVLGGNARRRRRLQERFGPEYDKVVGERSSRRTAEAELAARQRRVRKLRVHDLSDASREKYAARWIEVQERFVDDPPHAISDAQVLVEAVMEERGYPISGYRQAVADLSVAHARVLDHFRSAHEVSDRASAGHVTTEDLRIALLQYRELFDDLLGVVVAGGSHVGAA